MTAVLFCGQSSYPREDSATANRYRTLAQMTAELGYEVIFVNRHPPFRRDEPFDLCPDFGVMNPSGKYRLENWLPRQLCRSIAALSEFMHIFRLARKRDVRFINVYTQFAFDLVFYFLLSKLIGAECVIHITENRSQLSHRTTIGRINDRVYDFFACSLFNRFVSISSILEEMILARCKSARIISIPPVFRFELMNSVEPVVLKRPYFVYCASSAYEDVIWFVIQSYNSMANNNADLVLIINGPLSPRIATACKANSQITHYSNLDYNQLLSLYKGALALLIPLRDTAQDKARYPQKISEYLASGRPIISTRLGEVGRHFVHNETALLTDEYNVGQFAALMDLALSQPTLLGEVAQNGYKLGRQLFDSHVQSQNLRLVLV